MSLIENQNIFKGQVFTNEPMSKHTSWRTGGAAEKFVVPESINDLSVYLQSLPDDEKIMFIGLGSNTLIREGGIKGSVIALQGVDDDMRLINGDMVQVGAGVPGAKLSRFCVKHQLLGAEFFAGIPGLIGGALAMNAGAFGGETWTHVVSVRTINRSGEFKTREASEFEVGYRSVKGLHDEWFVSAVMKFKKAESLQTSDLIDIKSLLKKRGESQPTGVASCGSVFKNPKGDFAARLIESCKLKGKRIGGAVVSEKHANFIVNDRQATATDIEQLIEYVQHTVEKETGVLLECEVKILGERS